MALRFSPARGAASLVLSSLVRGPVGAAATATAGTTTTGAEGTSAAVSNSGSAAAAIFDFTIPRGASPAVGYTFSTTTTDSDPGNGIVRFNNATPAGITAIYFDNLDADGNTVTGWLDSFDDSTSTSKGTLTFTDVESPSTKLIFGVSGSVVDGAGYRKATVVWVSGATLFTAARRLAVTFSRAGDAGTGDVSSNTVTSVDGEMPLFSGTAGKTIKRSTLTGLLKSLSGVPAVAAAGTDYYNPGGTDVAVADGGTGSSTASGARTNLGLGAGDSPQFAGINIGDAADTTVTRGSGGDIAVEGNVVYRAGGTDVAVADGGTGASSASAALANLTARGQGRETIFIPASAMVSRTTNGPSLGSVEQTSNKNMISSLDFDTNIQEFAQFSVWFPKSWNLGTVTFQPSFSQLTTAAGGVVFRLAGVAVSDGDALDVAFGTAQTSTKTAGTANLEYQGPESAAITIAGTPAAGDRVMFQINRTVADGSDTLVQDARLHGVRLFFTTNAVTDA
jgi:hypothetical protein